MISNFYLEVALFNKRERTTSCFLPSLFKKIYLSPFNLPYSRRANSVLWTLSARKNRAGGIAGDVIANVAAEVEHSRIVTTVVAAPA